MLPLPQAWRGCGLAQPAARLLGHLLASWPEALGPFKRVRIQSNRRTRLLLMRHPGSQRRAELLNEGAQLSRDQALQMVRQTAAQGAKT